MALDLYVMPLAAYFSGDFEAIAGGRGSSREAVDAELARDRVEQIQAALSEKTSCDVTWADEGPMALSRRFDARLLHALRSFAAHHEHPPRIKLLRRTFKVLDDPRDHKSLRKIYEGAPTQYEHLMRHSDNRGFYVPCEFPEPAVSNEQQWWMIGSSPRLRDELARIETLFDEETPDEVREATRLLHEAASVSASRGLPLIWD